MGSEMCIRDREWAADGRLLKGDRDAERSTDRLPPGQRLVENWPVLYLGVQPDIPKDKCIFTIDGLVEIPVRWNWGEFLDQPQVTMTSDIHYVTG